MTTRTVLQAIICTTTTVFGPIGWLLGSTLRDGLAGRRHGPTVDVAGARQEVAPSARVRQSHSQRHPRGARPINQRDREERGGRAKLRPTVTRWS